MQPQILNFNVGILGHVDSGKTSLAKALSTTASTAAFDKNPQSKERGITLDLGFSSFQTSPPDHLKEAYESVQYTLVDCPGHASLIKTVIGGAQIIDLMILVVDIVKGMQTQTAECLVIGEITCSVMLVVLNKVDLLPDASRDATIQKMTKKMKATLSTTKFKDAKIVAVAAKSGGADSSENVSIGMEELVATLKEITFLPKRSSEGPALFAVDHCFLIKGKGTVMTGTVLQGTMKENDNVEVAALKEVRKIKSIQMFKKSVQRVEQGDRAGICVTQFDPNLLERGLVSSPGYLPTAYSIVIPLNKIRFYKGDIATGNKFHVSIGHATVMGTLTLFRGTRPELKEGFSFNKDYLYVGSLSDAMSEDQQTANYNVWALVEFEHPTVIAPSSKVLGSKLDTDINASMCRLAFEGQVEALFTSDKWKSEKLTELKVFKIKEKLGQVERANNDYELIGKNMFKKEGNIHMFDGFKVTLSTGGEGVMDGPFGQSGKFKIRVTGELPQKTKDLISTTGKGKKANKESQQSSSHESVQIKLAFKKYIFSKALAQ